MERVLVGDVRGVLRAVVTAALAGCGGDWPTESGGWTTATCTDGEWRPLEDATFAQAFDSVLMSTAGVDAAGLNEHTIGEPCATATDEAACLAEVERLVSETYASYLLTTLGDDVQVWTGVDGVREALGTIDHPTEALMLAWADGGWVTCDDLETAAQRVSPDGGFDVVTTYYRDVCSPIVRARALRHVGEDGAVEVVAEQVIERSMACIGRRPEGLRPLPPVDAGAVGRWLAEVAALEAASVPAFRRLAEELRSHGAPEALVGAAVSAADDEVRHARQMAALARRYGADVVAPVVDEAAPRDLLALAIDNACEGCVRETFGAALGAWQAARAADPLVAAVMRRIADDEAGHAELSWHIAAWLDTQLDAAGRAAVAAARAEAVAALREAADVADPACRAALGLPDVSQATALVDGLAAQLWAA